MFDLILQPDEFTSAHGVYTEHIYKKHFNVLMWDPTTTYNKKTTIFLFYFNLAHLIKFDLINNLHSDGYKIVLDQLHDSNNIDYDSQEGMLRLHISDWYWVNEFYINKAHELNEYVPNRTYSKKAFMPMLRQNIWRDRVFDLFKDQHHDMIYSYNNNPALITTVELPSLWDRSFNPAWFNETCFSIVVETRVMFPPDCHEKELFVTEKTWKPIAFSHPFIFIAEPTIISYLHSRGFETYNNLFDESYELITDPKTRIHNVHQQVVDFNKRPYDKLTLEKIDFNRNLFYNEQRVNKIIEEQIINPILEYAET